jgi:hypothetical protein
VLATGFHPRRPNKHERPFHVHRRRDELKVAGVAREPQIADERKPIEE